MDTKQIRQGLRYIRRVYGTAKAAQPPGWYGRAGHQGLTMDTVPVRLPDGAEPGAVVELYRDADGRLAAQVRIPVPVAER
jgi:hypothetical protein